MTASQAVMVISGYNTRAVVAFCRWATRHGIAYHIIAQGDSDPIFQTDYRDRVDIVRRSSKLDSEEFSGWLQALQARHSYERLVILPSTEYLNRFMLQHRSEIESAGGIVPLVAGETYARVSDKHAFAVTCETLGLDVPKEYPQVPAHFPFVAKPRKYKLASGASMAPALIFSRQELAEFERKHGADDYFFQEYVGGKSIYLLAYIGRDGEDLLFSQENLMQQAGGGSILLARASDFHHSEMAQSYLNMLKAVSFYGLVMVEVRYDKADGRCYMIEANPRLWGPMQFALDNGVDFFAAMLRDLGFEPTQSSEHDGSVSHYFWSGGFAKQGLPVSYHNYSGEQFARQYAGIRGCDIFLREDTLRLFYHETKMACDNE